MRIAIIFDSVTGNTRLIAEAIRQGCEGEEIVCFGTPQNEIKADCIFVGTWINNGRCSEKISQYLKSLTDEKIDFFGTACTAKEQDYRKFENDMKALAGDSNRYLGCFFCQGKLRKEHKGLFEKLLAQNPDDENLKTIVLNFDSTLTHPDDLDRKNAMEFARSVMKQITEDFCAK